MNPIVRNLAIALLSVILLPSGLLAQEKNLKYYNDHEDEILPDAQVAFRVGSYDRAVILCGWHHDIVGDDKESVLRDKAEQCVRLSKEMTSMQAEGNMIEAKKRANALLALNPYDWAAKAMLLVEEPVPPVKDTVSAQPPVEPGMDPDRGQKDEAGNEPDQEPPKPQVPIKNDPVPPRVADVPHTRFVAKAGCSIIDLYQVPQSLAPGASIGLYDMGGSRIGFEAGGYFCPLSASFIGLDASLVFRAAKWLYPKAGAGVFLCNATDGSGSSCKGLCAGAGLNFLFAKHLCLEIGAKYYPSVCLSGVEKVNAASSISYDFPVTREIISAGIAPTVSIGWAF